MHAVFKTGGKQYRATEGDVLRVEKLSVEEGATIDFEEVLLLSDGETVTIGEPFIAGGKVTAVVQGQGRGKKIKIIKFRRRKHSRKQMGHRQSYTEVKITAISAG